MPHEIHRSGRCYIGDRVRVKTNGKIGVIKAEPSPQGSQSTHLMKLTVLLEGETEPVQIERQYLEFLPS